MLGNKYNAFYLDSTLKFTKPFIDVISVALNKSLWDKYFPHFSQGESSSERLRNLAKVIQLISDLVSQFFWLAMECVFPSVMGSSGLPALNLRSDSQCSGAELGWGHHGRG